jgi:hypothetical protein
MAILVLQSQDADAFDVASLSPRIEPRAFSGKVGTGFPQKMRSTKQAKKLKRVFRFKLARNARSWIGGGLLNALMFGNNDRLGRLIDGER